jgi:hypothetical protein
MALTAQTVTRRAAWSVPGRQRVGVIGRLTLVGGTISWNFLLSPRRRADAADNGGTACRSRCCHVRAYWAYSWSTCLEHGYRRGYRYRASCLLRSPIFKKTFTYCHLANKGRNLRSLRGPPSCRVGGFSRLPARMPPSRRSQPRDPHGRYPVGAPVLAGRGRGCGRWPRGRAWTARPAAGTWRRPCQALPRTWAVLADQHSYPGLAQHAAAEGARERRSFHLRRLVDVGRGGARLRPASARDTAGTHEPLSRP